MYSLEKILKLRELIIKSSASLEDSDALEGIELFPAWQPDTKYYKNVRVVYNGKLYKSLKAHTSQSDWKPDTAASLYTEVALPDEGTHDNPIHYNNNMELEEGKYYTQADVLYLCIMSTGIPVYNDLKDLVGLYVEVAV